MWWKIIKNLTDHFNNDQNLKDIPALTIKAGVEGGIPDYPAIRVCRGGERKTDVQSKGRGTVKVLVDCWEGSDDQDPGVAYELINQLENKMTKSFTDWLEVAPDNLKIKMQLEGDINTTPDGDMFRPTVGSTSEITIKWNK